MFIHYCNTFRNTKNVKRITHKASGLMSHSTCNRSRLPVTFFFRSTSVQCCISSTLHRSQSQVHNTDATDRTTTCEVAAIARQRSTTRRRRVYEVLVESRVLHLETDDCSDGLLTVVLDH